MKYIFGTLFALYILLFYESVSPVWFNPLYTSSSGSSFLFTYYRALYPQVFAGDPVTEAVAATIPSIPLLLGTAITYLTEDAVMTGHWITVFQLLTPIALLGLGLRTVIPAPPLFLSLLWFIHTRPFIEQMAGGDPRGWAPTVIALWIFAHFQLKSPWRSVGIALSFFIHREAALICATTELALLLLREKEDRPVLFRKRQLGMLLLISTIAFFTFIPSSYLGPLLRVTSDEIALTRLGSGFGLLPFRPIIRELTESFSNLLGTEISERATLGVIIVWSVAALWDIRSRRYGFRKEFIVLGLTSFCLFLLSRHFGLLLHFPDRYLFYPFLMAQILAVPLFLWNHSAQRGEVRGGFALLGALGLLLFFGGSGLHGPAGLTTRTDSALELFQFLGSETPADAVIGGHPRRLNGIQLFGLRRGYITEETAIPYYERYLELSKERMELQLRALYASDRESFHKSTRAAGIDYMVFHEEDFEASALRLPILEIRNLPVAREILKESGGQFGASLLFDDEEDGVVYREDGVVVVSVRP